MPDSIEKVNADPHTDRRKLLANGYTPIPVQQEAKRPFWKGWNTVEITDAVLSEIEREREDHTSTGIRCGLTPAGINIIAIDNDSGGDLGVELDKIREQVLGPSSLQRIGSKEPGLHLYRLDGPAHPKIIVREQVDDPEHEGRIKFKTLFEVLSQGQQFVAYGTHPGTQRPYCWPNEWDSGDPLQTPAADLPVVSPAQLLELADALVERTRALGHVTATHTLRDRAERVKSNSSGAPVTAEMLHDMLSKIDPGLGREDWLKVGVGLACANVILPDGQPDTDFDPEDTFASWSRGDLHDGEPSNYAGDDRARYDFATLDPDKEGGSSLGSLIKLARDANYQGPHLIPLMERLDAQTAPPAQEPARGEQVVEETDEPATFNYRCADGSEIAFPQTLRPLHLQCNKYGTPKPSIYNAMLCARHLSATGADIAFDIFHQRIIFRGSVPWSKQTGIAVDDAALRLIRDDWIRHLGLEESKENVREAIWTAAAERPFHPVREYLDGLAWDGKARIDRWLCDYFDAADTPYVRAVGRKFLVAAVARIFSPGCKFDTMLVLEGPQGQGKSRLLRKLAVNPDWFSDSLPKDLSKADAVHALQGLWIIEAAELQGMRQSDVATIKAFLSRQCDRARFAYGEVMGDYPRQSLLVGTTNNSDYLRDPTGARRFWPVKVARADPDGIERDRDQLWAETLQAYRLGEPLELPAQLWGDAAVEQDARRRDDPWRETLSRYVDGRAMEEHGRPMNRVHALTLLTRALGMPVERATADQYSRLRDCMTFGLGWKWRKQVSIGNVNASGYVRPAEPWEPASDDPEQA